MKFYISAWLVAVAAMFALTSAHGQTPGTLNAAFEQKKAAEQGHAEAQFNLGVCYETGDGVAKNSKEAVKWYRKAAEQGHANAQNNLGFCYGTGEGVTKNSKEAVKWYRKAAEQGLAGAQSNLGVCYYNGNGVTKNYKEAALRQVCWMLLRPGRGQGSDGKVIEAAVQASCNFATESRHAGPAG